MDADPKLPTVFPQIRFYCIPMVAFFKNGPVRKLIFFNDEFLTSSSPKVTSLRDVLMPFNHFSSFGRNTSDRHASATYDHTMSVFFSNTGNNVLSVPLILLQLSLSSLKKSSCGSPLSCVIMPNSRGFLAPLFVV